MGPNRNNLAVVVLVGWVTTAFAASFGAAGQAVPPPEIANTPLAEIAGAPTAAAAPAEPDIEAFPDVLALYEAARSKFDDGRPDEALTRVEAALKIAPRPFYELYYLLAQIQTNPQQAIAAATRALELRPHAADAHFLIGGAAASIGDLASATAHFRSATLAAERELTNPNVTLAWFFLGQCLAESGRLLAAAESYERFDAAIWQSHPEHRNAPKVQLVLQRYPRGAVELRVDLYRKLHRTKDALNVTSAALERWPTDGSLVRLHARTLLADGQAREALRFARERMTAAEGRSGLMAIAVESAQAAGELNPWIDETVRSINEGQDAATASDMVAALKSIGAVEAATRLGKALLGRPGAPADLAWNVALTELSGGDVRAAVETLIRHVRAAPQLGEPPAQRLAEWVRAIRSRDGVADVLRQIREAGDEDAAALYVLGICALAVDRSDLADEWLGACLRARPDFAAALAARGRLLLVAHRWEEAKAEARALLQQHADLAAAYFILAGAHDGLDENDDAERAYKQAIRLAPQEPAYPLALANHYFRRGTPQDALGAQRAYSETLALDPRCGEAHEKLIEAYLQRGMGDLAREQLRRMQAAGVADEALRRSEMLVRHLGAMFGPAHRAELKEHCEAYPADARSAGLLIELLLRELRVEDADSVLRAALAATSGGDDDLRLLGGHVALARGDFAGAVAVLEELAGRYPNREKILDPLARAYLFDFRAEPARAIWRRLAQRETDAAGPYSAALLDSYVELGEWDGAVAAIDDLMQRFPAVESLAVRKIQILSLAGRTEQAFALADERYKAATDDSIARALYVEAGCDAGRFDAVLTMLRDALTAHPGAVDLTSLMVGALLRAKKTDEAIKLVREFNPQGMEESLQRRLWFGECYEAAGKRDVAIDEYEALLNERAVRPHQEARARQRLINLLIDTQQFDRALTLCDRWSRADEEGEVAPAALELRRLILQAAGREDEYIQVSRRLLDLVSEPTVLERNPDALALRVGLNNDLGYTWVDRGENLEKATTMIRSAVAADPLNAAYLDSLGWACYKAGDFEGAEKWLGRAIRVYGTRKSLWGATDPVQHDHYADALHRLGRPAEAVEGWTRALRFIHDEEAERPLRPDRVKLRQAVEAKLAAVRRGDPPAVAPTAAETKPGG